MFFMAELDIWQQYGIIRFPMNAIYLVIAGALFLTLAYRYYGAFLRAKVLAIDETRVTPVHPPQ